MTLEEKLEKFKAGTYVLHAPTKELWDKLMVELEKQGYKWLSYTTMTSKATWECPIVVKDLCLYCSDYNASMVFCGYIGGYRESALGLLEITEEDFAAPSETVESVTKSIEEVKADLKFYDELFKKYNVVMTGNLEPAMRERLESLLKKRVIS